MLFSFRSLRSSHPNSLTPEGITYTSSSMNQRFDARCVNLRYLLEPKPLCLRVLHVHRSKEAGLGHQIAEFLFALKLGERLDLTPLWERFEPETSKHGENYFFLNDLVGLQHLNKVQGDIDISGLRTVSIENITHADCGVIMRGSYASCSVANCFQSPATSLAFNDAAPILQKLSAQHGNWISRNPFVDADAVFHVVWHIRLGDEFLHRPGDVFYANVLSGFRDFFHDFYHVQHTFVGAWNTLSAPELKEYESFLSSQIPRCKFLSLTAEDSLLHMMHADLLIGSGSSMPSVAALFSNKVVYVNSEPRKAGQKGWGFLNEYFTEGLTADASGNILHHLSEVRSRFTKDSKRMRKSAVKNYRESLLSAKERSILGCTI